jgi:hypothetical protein
MPSIDWSRAFTEKWEADIQKTGNENYTLILRLKMISING